MLNDLNTSRGPEKQIEKKFSIGSNFTPQGHLTVSRDIFGSPD